MNSKIYEEHNDNSRGDGLSPCPLPLCFLHCFRVFFVFFRGSNCPYYLLLLTLYPLLMVVPMTAFAQIQSPPTLPPPVMREFRAAWVASVANIDFPSKMGLTTQQQKAELRAILDRAVALRLNAIIFQIRPACDALYDSKLEPWSEYLSGQQGKAPSPFYDPLAFAIDEAHKRGLELHAWFNPYRARHSLAKSALAESHLSKTQPELVKTYGKHLWLDPGEPKVQEHSLNVILDVVRRYDLDGVHVDDYFYPYKERDASGAIIDFPDEPSWHKYLDSGGTLTRDDWRRSKVDIFIERMYKAVKAEKVRVKVGISPFGIYRPGFPAQIKGFDQYTELYADARKWLNEGWLDYWTPQLYWSIEQTAQSFPVLLNYWIEQNLKGRHIWSGLYTSRIGDDTAKPYSTEEIIYQIKTARGFAGSGGHAHFSMKCLMQNRGQINDKLIADVYAQPALIPASPWLDATPPDLVQVTVTAIQKTKEMRFLLPNTQKAWLWRVSFLVGKTWNTQILPGTATNLSVPKAVSWVQVAAISRAGIEGQVVTLKVE